MPLPLARFLKPLPIPEKLSFPNIQKATTKVAGGEERLGDGALQAVEEQAFAQNLELLKQKNPHSIEQLQFIDKAVAGLDEAQTQSVLPILKRASSLKESEVSAAYSFFDMEVKSKKLSNTLQKDVSKGLEGRNIKEAIKSKFRGVDQTFKNAALRHENLLYRRIRNKSPEHLAAFEMLMKNPNRFKELYKIDQDQFATELISNPAGLDARIAKEGGEPVHPVVMDIVKEFNEWDKQVLNELQSAGVPIGAIDGFSAPLSIPADVLMNIGEGNFIKAFTDHVANVGIERLEEIVKVMKEKSVDFSEGSGFAFPQRKIKFKSPMDEIQFYKKMNGIQDGDGYSLVNDMLVHKKGIVKKGAIVAEFGIDPKQTFKKVLNDIKSKYKRSLKPEEVLDFNKLEISFNRLVDVYNGGKRVDSVFAERLGESFSAFTTFFTSASGSSYLRNLFDFSLNKAAVTQAIYNPQYTLGGTIFEQVENIGSLIAHALGGRAARAGVDKVLDIMGFGSSLDQMSHFNLLSYENMYDVTTPLNQLDGAHAHINNAMHSINNTLLTISGQNSFTDFRRARHLMTAQQHWSNMLDHVKDYKDWVSTLSPLEQNQTKYMEQAFGLGEKQFNALKKVGRTKVQGKVFGKEIPDFITAENIMKSDVGDLFFKRDLAVTWQNMMYNSSLNATPVPTVSDSIEGLTGLRNASSWMRFVIRPFMKFADVTQSQFEGVIDRVALASYGNRSGIIGFDKSMVHYTRAALVYTGGFMGLMWLKDMLYGKPPTDFTKKDALMGAFLQSGFGGYPLSVLNQALSLYGTSGGGIYGPAPIGGVVRGAKSFMSGVASDDPVRFYKAMRQVSRATGPGILWYTRGVADKALQQALLTKHQRRQLRRRQQGR